MGLYALFALAIGLAMDAFAVAVTLGLAMPRFAWRRAGVVGLYFGLFQAGMPVVGFFAGRLFADIISAVDTYVVFVLLVLLGGKMLLGARKDGDAPAVQDLSMYVMIPFALATSIDALAVGISFSMLEVNVIMAVALIGTITCVLSMVGVKIGAVFGARYRGKAMLAGGLILIAIGVRVLVAGLGVTAAMTEPIAPRPQDLAADAAIIMCHESGDMHSLAVHADGTLWAWGRNRGGRMGAEMQPHRFL